MILPEYMDHLLLVQDIDPRPKINYLPLKIINHGVPIRQHLQIFKIGAKLNMSKNINILNNRIKHKISTCRMIPLLFSISKIRKITNSKITMMLIQIVIRQFMGILQWSNEV